MEENMKILMYGWEFPPRISGGLGIACYAIVKELAKKGAKITLVLPYTAHDIIKEGDVNIIGCDYSSSTKKATSSTDLTSM